MSSLPANLLGRALRMTVFVAACVTCVSASEVKVTTSYLWDFFVTGVWDNELTYRHTVNDAVTLRGTLGYLDATQDAVSGINRLQARAGSLRLGGSWLTLWNCALIDAEGGIDILPSGRTAPSGKASIGAAVPLPVNPVVQNLRFKPSLWYTQRQANAAAIENRITSWGCEAEAAASLIAQRFDFGCNYRLDNQVPADSVLDTLLLDTLSSGRYPLPIGDNRLYGFYAYLVGKIAPFFQAGYAFSWGDCDEDRWVATRREPYVKFRGNGVPQAGLLYEYAYYPYPTQRRSLAHMAVVVVPLTFGSMVWQSKAAFPFYSQRELYSSPDAVPLGQESFYNYHFTQKFTGPLSLGSKLTIAATDRLSITTAYAYYCLPYREWAYFTNDSYSYHTITAEARLAW